VLDGGKRRPRTSCVACDARVVDDETQAGYAGADTAFRMVAWAVLSALAFWARCRIRRLLAARGSRL